VNRELLIIACALLLPLAALASAANVPRDVVARDAFNGMLLWRRAIDGVPGGGDQPPHASTTAYGRQPIVTPVVAGRMFCRGGNGIYCYDLRRR